MNPPRTELIRTEGELLRLLAGIRAEPLVALDTEAASFHRYHDRVYLLQVSTRDQTWIVDPLAVGGLPGVDALLGDPAVEIVFHDGDYDLRLLAHEFGYRARHLFDTRIAAQFAGETAVGLAALLEKYFGVTLDKRFQRADWSERPLSRSMLDYAATDTRHLPALRDRLREKLQAAGRLGWAEEEFSLLEAVRWDDPDPPEVAALEAKGARALKPRELAVFREVFRWRDQLARKLDRAPFRIAGNETLFALARAQPATPEELRRIRGMSREIREREEPAILAAVRKGTALPEDDLPRYPKPERRRYDPRFEARLDRLRETREALVSRIGLPPGLLAPNWLLESVARLAPQTDEELAGVPGLRQWQREVIGDQLIASVKK